jgi:hypothetical protein
VEVEEVAVRTGPGTTMKPAEGPRSGIVDAAVAARIKGTYLIEEEEREQIDSGWKKGR